MADNPLVATAPQTSWTGTANMKPMTSFSNASTDFEGAGLFSDAASTLSDATTAQGWTSGAAEMDIAGDAMDAIGVTASASIAECSSFILDRSKAANVW